MAICLAVMVMLCSFWTTKSSVLVSRKKKSHQVYLSLGSNLGDKEQYLLEAIRLIDEKVGTVTRRSTFINSKPWGFESEHQFLNAVILCETHLTPREVLIQTQLIEKTLGKKSIHATQRSGNIGEQNVEVSPQSHAVYKDRPIDIDILLYDDLSVDEPDLQIPHPLMKERDFVMVPLKEILNPN